jgi:aspartate/methionine/tyrosine aminotransferase
MDRLGSESAFEVMARARALEAEGRDIVHLEIGEPDFPTPPHIVEAGVEALREGYTHYGPTAGDPELREAIAAHVQRTRGVAVGPDQVVVTPGGKPIIFFTLLALVQQGDEVIFPNPGFPIYESMIRYVGARPVPMRLDQASGFHVDLDDLASRITDRTRLVVLNSPNNPCGSVMSYAEVAGLASILRGRDRVYVLSDEIYSGIVYTGGPRSIAAEPGMMERTIILDGFSKSYAMTGWRLGYGVFPPELVPHIVKLAVNSVSCAATFTQRAAIAALQGPQDATRAMVEEFRRRRDFMVEGLRAIPHLTCAEPEGAFYAFPNISKLGVSSARFEELALQEAGVALLGGQAFGRFGEGHVRLSYANSLENIAHALERLGDLVRRLAGSR